MRRAVFLTVFAAAAFLVAGIGLGAPRRARRPSRDEPRPRRHRVGTGGPPDQGAAQALRQEIPRRYDWSYYPYWRPYQYRYWNFYYPYGGPLF